MGVVTSIQSREAFADTLKGLAIIGVVFIHASGLLIASDALLVNGYFRWSVPVFIFLTSYFSIKSLNNKNCSYFDICKKRMIGLFLPFIFFSLIYFFITAENNLSLIKILTRHFAGYGWSGQYFFIILFQLVFLFPILARYKISSKAVIYLYVIYFIVYYFFGYVDFPKWFYLLADRPFIYWLPYVFLGAYLAQNDEKYKIFSSHIPSWLALFIILISPCLMILNFENSSFVSSYIKPSVLLVSTMIMLVSCSALKSINLNQLQYVGRNSLIVFCGNPLFIHYVYKSQLFMDIISGMSRGGLFIVYIFSTLFVVLGCLILGRVLKYFGLKQLVS